MKKLTCMSATDDVCRVCLSPLTADTASEVSAICVSCMGNFDDSVDALPAVPKRMQPNAIQARQRRIEAAARDDAVAAQRCSALGLKFVKVGDTAYSVSHPRGWSIEVYPVDIKLYASPDSKRLGAPFLRLRRKRWGLLDVVEAFELLDKKGALYGKTKSRNA